MHVLTYDWFVGEGARMDLKQGFKKAQTNLFWRDEETVYAPFISS